MGSFFSNIGAITWAVLAWLSLYFVLNIWIFIWRFLKLNDMLNAEKRSLELLTNDKIPLESTFSSAFHLGRAPSREVLEICKLRAVKQATAYLSMLAIISSTAPFIGLFGTVIEILEAFYHLGGEGKVSFEVIAPIISKALVATAFGILTAIPAYSFYILLKRKAYEVSTYLDMQFGLLLGGANAQNLANKPPHESKFESKITLG